MTNIEPASGCTTCTRLVEYRRANQAAYPDFHNAPVPSFGPLEAELLIVGLAPGLKGANWSGRPFTGDYAGDLLYPTIVKFGLGTGEYGARPDDGIELTNCRITNAVRCVPPQNKVNGAEITACSPYLRAEMAAMPNLRALIALGTVAHNAILKVLGLKQSAYKFGHCAQHDIGNGLIMTDSYHCSRYNTNTGRLTESMFHDVFKAVLG